MLPTTTVNNFYLNASRWPMKINQSSQVNGILGRLAFTRSKGADANLDKTRAKPWAKSTAKNTRRSAAAVVFSTSAAMGHEMKAKLYSKLVFSF